MKCASLLLLLFVSTILLCFVVSSQQQGDKLSKEQLKHKSLAAFWESINSVASDTEERLSAIADRIAQLGSNSSTCARTLELALRSGVREEWSAKLLGANSAASDLVWNLVSEEHLVLGNFADCLSLSNVSVESSVFSGKYCLVTVHTPHLDNCTRFKERSERGSSGEYLHRLAYNWIEKRNQIPLTVGVCVPSLCSVRQLSSLIDQYFDTYITALNITVAYCQPDDTKQNNNLGLNVAKAIIYGTILIGLCCTVLCSWKRMIFGDNLMSELLSRVMQVCSCFDCAANLGRLFSASSGSKLSASNGTYDLSFIHGLKAVLIMGSVFIHSFTFLTVYLLGLPLFAKYRSFLLDFQSHHSMFYTFIYRSILLVDLFFVISGFLASFTCLSQNKRLPNFLRYIFWHWLRFVPSMIAILCLTIVLQRAGSGPLFHKELTDPYVKPCHDYWWTHLLLINNFWTIDKMCGANLWYVSCTFQLHILLYAVLVIFHWRPSYSIIFTLTVAAVSLLLYPIFNLLGLPGLPRVDFRMNLNSSLPLESIRLFYTTPQSHILAYLCGVLIAMRLVSNRSIRPSIVHTLMVHVTFAGFLLATLLPALGQEENENKSLSHLVSFLAFFVLIILSEACCFYFLILDQGTLAKRLLTSQFLVPIGRLSFALYLLNPLVNWHHLHQMHQSPPLTFRFLGDMFLTDFLRCFFWSILFHLFFQAPFRNLLHLYGDKVERRPKQTSNSMQMTAA